MNGLQRKIYGGNQRNRMKEESMPVSVLQSLPAYDSDRVEQALSAEAGRNKRKIIVLDDDPTGVQTVHDVSVYTDWSEESLREGLEEPGKLFYILTNSRAFTEEQTVRAHREIARRAAAAAADANTDYLLVSRSDSTLRGHFPLETETLRQETERVTGRSFDGEVLCPFFSDGGRYTIGNVHYVKSGDTLVPAAETEFAQDRTFGYHASCLPAYVEEKTHGRFRAADCVCISLQELRAYDYNGIEKKLLGVHNFNKVIVNAVCDDDVKVFVTALYRALDAGKRFLFRTAASFVKALGDVDDRPQLTHEELCPPEGGRAGVIVAGSHTAKTTAQLEELKKLPGLDFIALDSDLVLEEGALQREVQRVVAEEEKSLRAGRSVCVYTRRRLLSVPGDTEEKALVRSVQISEAVQQCVGRLTVRPAFIVAKGGITSSDIGVKALGVRRALVMGQIEPGVPVWKTGSESRFPGVPYVIFPGNVGETDTLRKAVGVLMA